MGNIDGIIIALVFNIVDLLTGLTCALKIGELESSKLRDGLFKKVGFLVCYFMAWVIDLYGGLVGFSFSIKILPAILFYACGTEIVSIIENIHKINPDLLPEKLLKLFHVHDNKGE